VRLFGFPRTEELHEDGRTVQYFQRARFEYRPERAGSTDEVQLTPLVELATAAQRPFTGVPLPSAAAGGNDGRLVLSDPTQPGVGHVLTGAFGPFYQARGSERLFGLPLSEEVPWREPGAPPGSERIVQLFQRARFEYVPAAAGSDGTEGFGAVQLALVGDEVLRQRDWLDPPSPIGPIA